MKGYLSIGEVAKLMNLSTHQIRYFEEQGVLMPDRIGDNGYRMYGIHALYKVSHILYLREFGIPVGKIKECFESYNEEDYVMLFKDKVKELDDELHRITTLKEYTMDMVNAIEKKQNQQSVFSIVERKERVMTAVLDENSVEEYTLKDFYKDFKGTKDLYKMDFATYICNQSVYSCIFGRSDSFTSSEEIILPKGEYLNYLFSVNEESKAKEYIKEFYRYAYAHDINLEESLIIRDNAQLSIGKNKEMYYEIEAKLV